MGVRKQEELVQKGGEAGEGGGRSKRRETGF